MRSVTVKFTLYTRLSVVALRLEVSAGPRGWDALMEAVACWMESRTLMLLKRTFGSAGFLSMALSRLASAVLTPPREAWIDPKSRLISCSVPVAATKLQQLVAASSTHVVKNIWSGVHGAASEGKARLRALSLLSREKVMVLVAPLYVWRLLGPKQDLYEIGTASV